ncbi:MAG: hypothetical protein IJP01_06480 [Oscillospiraceae bacterium]|nr:hypothetical protein [Oscillospiraceae bacterium]
MDSIMQAAAWLTTVAAAAAVVGKMFGRMHSISDRVHNIAEGQKCILRSDMMRTYYRHHDERKIRQYEFENFIACYKAYKALDGNSFIDKIYAEVLEWEVIS